MHIIGLDVSSTATGITVLHPKRGSATITSIRRLTGRSKAFDRQIHPNEFSSQIFDILTSERLSQKNVTVCIEEYNVPRKGRQTGLWVCPFLGGYLGGYLSALYNTKPHFVNQYLWKRNLIKRRTKGKEFVEEHVYKTIERMNWKTNIITKPDTVGYEDAMDSFGIAYYAFCELNNNSS